MIELRPIPVGGVWVPGARDPIGNRDPSDPGDPEGLCAAAAAADVAAAVQAARRGRQALAAMAPQARVDALAEAGRPIEAEAARTGELLAREEGMPIAEARAEVVRAGPIFRQFAGDALRGGGASLPSLVPGATATTARLPLGVLAIITPRNLPAAIPARTIAPAPTWGNAVVFKPAELACATAEELVAILAECGLAPWRGEPRHGPRPRDRRGPGRGAGTRRDQRHRIRGRGPRDRRRRGVAPAPGAAGTRGQEPAGRARRRRSRSRGRGRRIGVSGQTGRRCTAWSRMVVSDAVHDRFVAAFARAADAIPVGDARDPATRMGPAAGAARLRQDLDCIALARGEGPRRPTALGQLPGSGHVLRPAVLTDGGPDMRPAREEVFGPVALAPRAGSFQEAVASANDTPRGLTAGIITASPARTEAFRRAGGAGGRRRYRRARPPSGTRPGRGRDARQHRTALRLGAASPGPDRRMHTGCRSRAHGPAAPTLSSGPCTWSDRRR
jgi:aldehyde dehydrogenase (NAD+)